MIFKLSKFVHVKVVNSSGIKNPLLNKPGLQIIGVRNLELTREEKNVILSESKNDIFLGNTQQKQCRISTKFMLSVVEVLNVTLFLFHDHSLSFHLLHFRYRAE